MQGHRQALLIALLMLTVFFAGCAGQQARTMPPFQATDLASGGYERKVDNFVILFDASSSMDSQSMGLIKFETAKAFVKRLNTVLPELGYQDAFVSFGHHDSVSREHARKHHGLKPYTTNTLTQSLAAVTESGGTTPMAKAFAANHDLLGQASGKIALIIVSDGLDNGTVSLDAATKALAEFGDRLCVYPVLVGDASAGRQLMTSLAKITGCGFFTQAEETLDGAAMADFVTRVFLTAKAGGPKDTDGDGVYDHLDRCPGTPRGTAVDAQGCPLPAKPAGPLDMDGDGIYDDDDLCPSTPQGAKVDNRGCWVLEGVEFATNEAVIRPQYEAELEAVVDVLHQNPHVKVQIQGHTDSVGDANYNRQLSDRRARAVLEWLIGKGIDRQRLSAIGMGETRPIASNDSAAGRDRNRRVELKPLP
ncbi:MAG: OmpA family protein [Desulfobacterales bacterium]|nr:OmpA family protein [Desulfobacterales bacterium]